MAGRRLLFSSLATVKLVPFASHASAAATSATGLLFPANFTLQDNASGRFNGGGGGGAAGCCRSFAISEHYNSSTRNASLLAEGPSPGHLRYSQLCSNSESSRSRIGSFQVLRCGPTIHAVVCQSTLGYNGHVKLIRERPGLQMLVGKDAQENLSASCRSFTVKTSSSADASGTEANKKTVVRKDDGSDQEMRPRTLDDFQHEEITGPTVERDLSAVANELRDSIETLRKQILSFRTGLIVLGSVQCLGAWWSYLSWHSLNPTWQLVPSVLTTFILAFILRQVLQPIEFFGKLEERSRLRLVTLSLMISKGFASFFNRARILVTVLALGLVLGLLYTSSAFLLAFAGLK